MPITTEIRDISCEDAKEFICESSWGFAKLDSDGFFDWVNKAYAEKILNAPVELVIGTHFRDWTHQDDREIDEALANRIKSGELNTYSLAKRYIQRGSTPQMPREIWGRLNVIGNFSPTGEFVGYRVQFQPYSLPPRTHFTDWKKAGEWALKNWKTVLTILVTSITLIWGGSDRLSSILRDLQQAESSVESALPSD